MFDKTQEKPSPPKIEEEARHETHGSTQQTNEPSLVPPRLLSRPPALGEAEQKAGSVAYLHRDKEIIDL